VRNGNHRGGFINSKHSERKKQKKKRSEPLRVLNGIPVIQVSLEIAAYTQTLPAIIKAESSLDRIIGVRGLSATGGATRGLGPADGSAQVLTGAQSRERDQKLRELDENRSKCLVKLKTAKGVASMGVGKWESAAREFMNIDGKLEEWEGKVKLGKLFLKP
jgi:hypothetical protein